ncbi:MAG: hypothetical protein LBV41_02935 [Cytophagaceae bacterium]|jgi:hypothetical protein|nr:hypothetical protein [Cytophagaceae bacterium]
MNEIHAPIPSIKAGKETIERIMGKNSMRKKIVLSKKILPAMSEILLYLPNPVLRR